MAGTALGDPVEAAGDDAGGREQVRSLSASSQHISSFSGMMIHTLNLNQI